MSDFTLYHGDCLGVLKGLADNSIDSMAADPPAGISFMGLEFDHDKGGRDKWIEWLSSIMKECYRVLKPGGHAAVWALPRTSHWTGMALELSGFEVRDCISYLYDSGRDVTAFLETLSSEQRNMLEIILANGDDSFNVMQHLFGSGFPKSLDISKAIDKSAGMEREVVGISNKQAAGFIRRGRTDEEVFSGVNVQRLNEIITAPASAEAKQWDGWHTSLKPAFENWWLVRKPLSEPTIAANVLRWGVGGLNIDACRVATGDDTSRLQTTDTPKFNGKYHGGKVYNTPLGMVNGGNDLGRFPSHLIHDGSAPVEAEFARAGVSKSSGGQSGVMKSGVTYSSQWNGNGNTKGCGLGDVGTPSRFFYCAKPSSRERNEGLDGFEEIGKSSLVKLRDNLTKEQVDYVTAELKRCGVIP